MEVRGIVVEEPEKKLKESENLAAVTAISPPARTVPCFATNANVTTPWCHVKRHDMIPGSLHGVLRGSASDWSIFRLGTMKLTDDCEGSLHPGRLSCARLWPLFFHSWHKSLKCSLEKFTTCAPKSLDNITVTHCTGIFRTKPCNNTRNSRYDMLCSGKVLFARHWNKSTHTWSWLCSDRYCIAIESKKNIYKDFSSSFNDLAESFISLAACV